MSCVLSLQDTFNSLYTAVGHFRVLQQLRNVSTINGPFDRMLRAYRFIRSFEVDIQDGKMGDQLCRKALWCGTRMAQLWLNLLEQGTRAGTNLSKILGSTQTIFQVKIYDIDL